MLSRVHWAGLSLAFGLSLVGLAFAQVYHQVSDLLSEQFRHATAVSFERVQIGGQLRGDIERVLQRPLPKAEYVIYVAKRDAEIVGYASFDQERGEHELIDFATFFDAGGKVTRTEVVAYREAYGSEIRRESFRKQFLGKNAAASYRIGHDVDAVSGATISSASMSRAVQRAAVVLDKTLLAGSPR